MPNDECQTNGLTRRDEEAKIVEKNIRCQGVDSS